jgi:hypothetical protein
VLQVTPHLPLQNRVILFLHFQVEQLQQSLQQVQQEEQRVPLKVQVLFQLVPNQSQLRLRLLELVEEVELEEPRVVLSQSAPAVHLSTALFF